MAQDTWVQYQVESYQRLKKWHLMPPCLTVSIIRYGSRVKWSNPRKGVVPSPTPWCSSYQKGSLWVNLNYDCQLYFYFYCKRAPTPLLLSKRDPFSFFLLPRQIFSSETCTSSSKVCLFIHFLYCIPILLNPTHPDVFL